MPGPEEGKEEGKGKGKLYMKEGGEGERKRSEEF